MKELILGYESLDSTQCPFLESPDNPSGPELYFKIKICTMVV